MNAGKASVLTGSLSGAQLTAMETALKTLATTAPAMFLVGILERLAAVTAQLALSVLVFFGVKKKKTGYYLLAVFLHLALDASAVIVNSYVKQVLLTELVVWIVAGCCAAIAVTVWKKEHRVVLHFSS